MNTNNKKNDGTIYNLQFFSILNRTYTTLYEMIRFISSILHIYSTVYDVRLISLFVPINDTVVEFEHMT